MSDPAKRTTQERMLAAFHSSDLSLDANSRKDADVLIALGRAEQQNGRVSGDVMRLHLAGSAADYRSARESVVALAKHMNVRRNWRLSQRGAREVGELALLHHVHPACPACKGRAREAPEGSPYLTGNICKPCHGTGTRPVQTRFNTHIRDLVAALEQIDQITERTVARLLR
jgi:hypothetical protein